MHLRQQHIAHNDTSPAIGQALMRVNTYASKWEAPQKYMEHIEKISKSDP
jgi:hypothetical protein